jgi:asparagine synthase (glutamine-hydrolysing)
MASSQSPFLEINAIPPNSVAIFGQEGFIETRSIFPEGPLTASGGYLDLGDSLTDSIHLHLSADVPTALLLSSGVDSATIAAIGRRLGRDLNCLTIATPDVADESPQAAETAHYYGHRFQSIQATLDDRDVIKFFGAMQRPSVDGLNTYIVSKAVHEAGYKVALSGLGGDEALGGYSHFRLLKYLTPLSLIRELPPQLSGIVAKVLAQKGLASEAKAMRLLDKEGPRDGLQLSLLQREVLPVSLVADLTGNNYQPVIEGQYPASGSFSEQFISMVAAEVAIYLEAMLLPDADSFSMASSVELRVPFVDRHVFKASLAFAESRKRRPAKAAIGIALDDPYLRNLAARKKRGFSVPMRQWMSGPLSQVLYEADGPDAAIWSVIDRTVAERARLLPLRACGRWTEPWAFSALNAWLENVGGEMGGI